MRSRYGQNSVKRDGFEKVSMADGNDEENCLSFASLPSPPTGDEDSYTFPTKTPLFCCCFGSSRRNVKNDVISELEISFLSQEYSDQVFHRHRRRPLLALIRKTFGFKARRTSRVGWLKSTALRNGEPDPDCWRTTIDVQLNGSGCAWHEFHQSVERHKSISGPEADPVVLEKWYAPFLV